MTPEEAIKNLKKLKSYHNGSYGTAIDLAIKALEQARWIPCSERPPEEGQKVLATDKFEAVTTAIYFRKSPFWREMVVAWKPLPQAYKAESEGGDTDG